MNNKSSVIILGLLLISILSLYDVSGQNNSNFKIDNEVKPRVDVSIIGTSADDKIRGGEGDDEISGKYGDDILSGGKGNDELDGGSGVDHLDGGKGKDLFICDEQDIVIDFNSLENDQIQGNCKIGLFIDRLIAEREPFSAFENGGIGEGFEDTYNNGFSDDLQSLLRNPYDRLYWDYDLKISFDSKVT